MMNKSNLSSLPVYQKSLEVNDLSLALEAYFSLEKSSPLFKRRKIASLRSEIVSAIKDDAQLISRFISETVDTDCVELRSKHLTFINTITKNILSYCNGLDRDGVREKEYVNLLRQEIKLFRRHFKSWRKSLLA
ncbi:hypothetical protein GCM10011414_19950 [Croceivirga lutea]|nr:hypothetical protein GCM10011414_19950 [Croceivirga lutea]